MQQCRLTTQFQLPWLSGQKGCQVALKGAESWYRLIGYGEGIGISHIVCNAKKKKKW